MKNILRDKIRNHEAQIGVIGMGYVGLPLALTFLKTGFRLLGFDIDPKKISDLNEGRSYIKQYPADLFSAYLSTGKFLATTDFDRLSEVDCISICVPTPLTKMREPDLTYIVKTTEEIAKRLRKEQLIVLESTTYPGTTDELMLPRLEEGGLKVEKDFFLAFSPEREDPGNKSWKTADIPKVVGGVGPDSTELAKEFYQSSIKNVVTVSSARAAEMTKLLENIYRSINIALVNELKTIVEKMNIDIWEVIEAASTKPFGFTPFYPGPGLGGHCIPIDPFYLSWKAREYNITTRFIELAGEINTRMPEFVVEKTMDALNDRQKSLSGSNILILGVSYKKDIDDIRESPALEVIRLLQDKGATVRYNDPFFESIPPMRKGNIYLTSQDLTETLLQSVDAVIVTTAHSSYDYDWIVKHARLVIDTRNATQKVTLGREKIIKA
jgi:UDP-N-acetyl-D-glucosamine dehydrogenase